MANGDLKVTVKIELDDSGFASQIQSLLSQYDNLELKIKTPQLEGATKQVEEQKSKLKQLAEEMQKTSDKVVKFGQTATAEGSKLSTAFKPVVEFGEDCIKTASEVDYLQTQISAIAGVDKTNKAYTTLQQTISNIAKSSKFTGAEVSETALIFTKAGFSLEATNKMLEATKNGALASGIDMQKMASGVGNAIRSFNLDASDATRVIDVLSKTANMSNTDLSSMITTLSNCSGTAGTLGLDITQVAGALGTMSNQGMQAGKASTQLRNIMLTLAEGAVKYNDGLHNINVATVDSQGNFRSLTDIFADLSTQCATMTDAQKVAFAETLVGKTNVEGFLDLLNNSDSLNNFNLELQSCEGTAKNFAEVMGETTQGKMDTFNSQLENMKTSIGDKLRPTFENILDVVGKFCDVLSNNATAEIISMAIEFGALVVALGTGIKVFGLITTAIGLLCSPIGMVVGILAGLGVAIYEVCTHFDFLKEVASNCWEAIQGFFGNIGEWFSEKWQGFKQGAHEAFESVTSSCSTAWETIHSTVSNAVENVKSVVQTGWGYIKDNVIAPVNQAIGQLIDGDWNGFKQTISNAVSKIKEDISNGFKSAAEAVGNALREMKETIINKLKEAVSSAITSIGNFKNAIVSGMKESVSNVISSIGEIKNNIVNGFKTAVSNVISSIGEMKNNIISGFSNIVSSIGSSCSNIISVASSGFSNLKAIIGTVVRGIAGDISSAVGNWVSAMRTGAQNAVSACVSAFSGLGQKIMAAVSGAVGMISQWWGSIKSIFAGGISATVNITKRVTEGSLSSSDMMTLDNNEFMSLDSSNNILTNSAMSLSSVGVNANNIRALDKQTVLLQEISDKLDKPQQVITNVNAEVKNDVDIDTLVKKIETHQRRELRRSGARLGMSY